jgi:phosphatidate cytidylyltransferase
MLRYRLMLGPVLIVGLILLLWIDELLERWTAVGGLALLGLFLVIVALASREVARVMRAKGVLTDAMTLFVSAVVGLLGVYLTPGAHLPDLAAGPVMLLATGLGGVMLLALVGHALGRRAEGAILATGAACLAVVYLGVLPGFYLALRSEHSAWLIAAVILITKFCDIGAFTTGKLVGRHKLIPWLSPGKTWEGLVGGVAASAALAVGLALLLAAVASPQPGEHPEVFRVPLWYAALAGAILGGVGVLGDLAASLIKRDAGVKDSGTGIPGFGGVLDVVDSAVVVAPVGYWLVILAPTAG